MSKQSIAAFRKRLHGAESGEVPIGPMLLIGLIVIPMVFLLVKFKDKIMDTTASEANDLLDAGETSNTANAPTIGR